MDETKFRKWYAECILWLGSLGFEEIYQNHPALPFREYHWIKNGIRICCVYDPKNENFCYIHQDIVSLVYPIVIKSCRYKIGDPEVLKIHDWFQRISFKIE